MRNTESETKMFERFAKTTRAAVENARVEAERRGDRRIGSDHLLIGLLLDDETARLVGVTAAAAREAVDRLDRDALTAIGFDVGGAETAGRAASGAASAADRRMPGKRVTAISTGAKGVIERSLANAAAGKARAVTSEHMLLALLDRRQPDPAATLLAALPIDVPALRERLTAA
jgi:ATP-dependent Clp protease ATP-binding subunit ClpA